MAKKPTTTLSVYVLEHIVVFVELAGVAGLIAVQFEAPLLALAFFLFALALVLFTIFRATGLFQKSKK